MGVGLTNNLVILFVCFSACFSVIFQLFYSKYVSLPSSHTHARAQCFFRSVKAFQWGSLLLPQIIYPCVLTWWTKPTFWELEYGQSGCLDKKFYRHLRNILRTPWNKKPFLHSLSFDLGCMEIILFCPETWKSYLVVHFKSVLNHKLLYWWIAFLFNKVCNSSYTLTVSVKRINGCFLPGPGEKQVLCLASKIPCCDQDNPWICT